MSPGEGEMHYTIRAWSGKKMEKLEADILVGQPVSFVAPNLIFCPLASQKTTSVATAMQVIFRLASDQNIFVFS
jgi:hypothetical protein